jgi:phosphoribosylglycinamide formyltransferase-1/phosphoribosylamine--glycine ligase/phosphoribosylglycinamide formyltransferase/phosphoribosylformylglycinamidine cyclo-ligase
MATRTREDRRLRLLSAVCLGLPEAERINCGAHADFRVRGRIFAYFLRSHGGDGITAACFKTRLGEHIERVKQSPDRFYLPRFIGRRGWLGLRLDQGDINWDEVRALAAVSYDLAAAKGRPAPPPIPNAVTASLLIRGKPPVINISRSPAQVVDGNLLRAELLVEQRGDSAQPLRSTALPETASASNSAALRSRR